MMNHVSLILGTIACTFSLWGCGQKGALYLPAEPAAQNRATLPQAINPLAPSAPASAASAAK
jgi:predicted small lipoprotein YifL